jgi:hypothetical protein
MSEWLAGLPPWAGVAALALALWMLVGLLVAVGFGYLVARDEGPTAVRDATPDEVARGEPRVLAVPGQAAAQFQVAPHTLAGAHNRRGELTGRGRTALQPEAARPVPPHRQTGAGHGAC